MPSGGEGIRLRFEVSEPLPEDQPPLVLFRGGERWTRDEQAAGSGFEFFYVAEQGTDQEGATELVLVQLLDAAQNPAEQELPGLVFDFTPPVLAQHGVVPAEATTGSVVTISVTAQEELQEAPALSVASGQASLDFGEASQAGRTYTWSREVQAQDAAGTYDLAVAMADLAGNPGSEQIRQALEIDRQGPGVLAWSVAVSGGREPWPRLLKAGDVLGLSFAVSERLQEEPRVTLGSRTLGRPSSSTEGEQPVYSWTLPIPALQPRDAMDEGALWPSVALVDRAGNRSTDSESLGQVSLDFTPPAVRLGPHTATCGPGVGKSWECAYPCSGCAGEDP
ncbi:MAG: hypothetical protein FJ125_05335, partial [Deltaproteobacteria bacterium]|nr:hypothetical protein [Deltaproteobacteria bacterium]